MNLDTGKQKVITEEEATVLEFTQAINDQPSNSVKVKLLALYKNQQTRDDLLEKGYNEEFYNLEYKYNQEYMKINKEISEIINKDTPIENYWKIAIENAKFFPVNDKDKEILKFLTNIEVIHDPADKKSFTAYFYFAKNLFFDHSILEKAYKFNKKEDSYTESKATEIKWKGSAPNIKLVKKKVKKGKNINTIIKEKTCPSFFNIFVEKEEEDNEEEKEDEPDLNSEADFIQNDLVPFSMEYYLDLQKLSGIDDGFNDDEEEENSDDESKKKKKK